jgi:hypothetical protein
VRSSTKTLNDEAGPCRATADEVAETDAKTEADIVESARRERREVEEQAGEGGPLLEATSGSCIVYATRRVRLGRL